MAPTKLPDCGLYRTTKALPGHEEKIPAGLLVYFHNHSDSGLPQVIPPDHNVHNRWHFHGPGILIRGLSWIETLVKMPAEGFYVLRRDVPLDGGGRMQKGTLVQLGYQNNGTPILFIARERNPLQENDLFFSHMGNKISRDQLSALEPVLVHREERQPGTNPNDDSTPPVH